MCHFLYIIHSVSKSKYYVGETHNVQERLLKHNKHLYDNSFTKIADDWTLMLSLELEKKDDAVFLENFIKLMKSKKFIEKIIIDASILIDILNKK